MRRVLMYFVYRLHSAGSYVVSGVRNFVRHPLETLWVMFLAFITASSIIYLVRGDTYYLLLSFVVVVPLIVITVYFDFRKGDFMHWYRSERAKRYTEKLRKDRDVYGSEENRAD